MVMLFEKTPRPSNGIPRARAPCCVRRRRRQYCPQAALLAGVDVLHGERDAVGILIDAHHLLAFEDLGAGGFGASAQNGLEARLRDEQPPAGTERVPSLVEARDDVGELSPDRSMMTSAPSGSNSLKDCARTCCSMPALRNISSVRMWKNAARGSGEPPRRRSTASEGIPCWARNIAVDRPIRPRRRARLEPIGSAMQRGPSCASSLTRFFRRFYVGLAAST